MINLITDHMDIWTSAQTQKTNGAGRGKGSANNSLHGIKKLRELIFELAVRGKLVPQDHSDEPASVLLGKIAAERARLVKEGKLKKQEPLPEITDDEKLFELPQGWEWVRLGEVGNIFNGNSISEKIKEEKYTYINGGLSFIATKDVGYGWDTLDYNNGVSIPENEPRFKIAHARAVLICAEGGSAGKKCGITNQDIYFGNKLFANELCGNIESSYILTNYLRPTFFNQFSEKMTGIIGGVSSAKFIQLLIPIPPLYEQHRIVAKVDELMAICDQLEQQQTDNKAAHQTLVETLLAILTSATNQDEFIEAWQRIANHFDILFTTEKSIDQLKQTILQLAVMGKLVPQDPNDEPASVLLKNIAAEKSRLIKEGKIRKQERSPEIADEEKPFERPQSWKYVRFGDVTYNRDSERVPLSVDERRGRQGDYDYYGASGIIDSIDEYLFDKPLLLIGEDGANLINRSTPIAFMARGKYWVNNHAHVIDGLKEELLLYICLHINAISLEPYVTGTAQPKMNQAKMNSIVLALPPLSEQQRIVAKVDELMAICDALKERLNDAQTTQIQLADTIVEQAVA